MNTIHIHEDDWGMRCLYPVAALPEIAADIAEAAAARERNRAPDGVGWTDVHVVKAPATDYSDHGLTLERAGAAIAPHLPRVRRFNATASAGFEGHDPMGAYETDAWAFGLHAGCFVKLEAKGDLVTLIWFECRTESAEERAALKAALLAIDALVPSAVADYWMELGGALRDPDFLETYVLALAGD